MTKCKECNAKKILNSDKPLNETVKEINEEWKKRQALKAQRLKKEKENDAQRNLQNSEPYYKRFVKTDLQKYWYEYIQNNIKNGNTWFFGIHGDWWHGITIKKFLEQVDERKFIHIESDQVLSIVKTDLEKFWHECIKNNLDARKPWYYGFRGDWWHGKQEIEFLKEVEERKFYWAEPEKTYEIEWSGGLGDVFRKMRRGNTYNKICNLNENERAKINLISHNPHCDELLKWHPKKHLLDVRNYGYWDLKDDAIHRKKHNLKWEPNPEFHEYKGQEFIFYPSPDDIEILDSIEGEFVVLSASAGEKHRNFPEHIIKDVVDSCKKNNVKLVAIGKSYDRNDRVELDLSKYDIDHCLIDKLSVAGTCELVKRCKGIITCHSGFNILGWFLRKPTLLLYPQEVVKMHFSKKERDEWSFGLDYPETIHSLFDDYNDEHMGKFLDYIKPVNLPNVTLLCIDCVNVDRALNAINKCTKRCSFGDIKLLTSLETDSKYKVEIPPINNIKAYSNFCIKWLAKYVDTDYVLLIQHDGYILNPNAWNDDFLKYDYIGSPFSGRKGVGNGGFSIRSKRLLNALQDDSFVVNGNPEDHYICVDNKQILENKYGIKFAPYELAKDFGVDNGRWSGQFGYHDNNSDLSELYKSENVDNINISNIKINNNSNHNNFFSIITPSNRSLKYITRLFDNLDKQTYRDFEHIIIYDGKPSKDIIEHINNKCSTRNHIKLYWTNKKTNNYGADQRNLGISKALGKCVVFLDDDDYYEPSYLQTFYDIITSDTSVNILPVISMDNYGDKIPHNKDDILAHGQIGTPMCAYTLKYLKKYNIKWESGSYDHDYLFTKLYVERIQPKIITHDKALIVATNIDRLKEKKLDNHIQKYYKSFNFDNEIIAEDIEISICCPTRQRPDSMGRLCDSIFNTAYNKNSIELIFYIDDDDELSINKYNEIKSNNVKAVIAPKIILAEAWNILSKVAKGDIISYCGDDHVFRTTEWDKIVLDQFKKYEDGLILVYGKDGIQNKNLATYAFISKKQLDIIGLFMPPYFHCDYVDTWLYNVYKKINRLIYIPDLYIEHLHFTVGKSDKDKIYINARKQKAHAKDLWESHYNEIDVWTEKIQKNVKKKIISFSLWGDDIKYINGAYENIKLAKELYPDWICRFYVDSKVTVDVINKIKNEDNTELFIMENKNGSWSGLFWRFYCAGDQDVNMFIVRDCDSRLSERERIAVKEWEESNMSFHIMKDHPYHGVPILGGMWGCRGNILKNIKSMILNWLNDKQINQRGPDQNFLSDIIYPLIKDKCMIHNGINHTFPVKYDDDYHYVGEIFNENNVRGDEWLALKKYLGENDISMKRTKCTKETWDNAQIFEKNTWLRVSKDYDDYNTWWANHFENYNFLNDKKYNSLIELGCGPYAKNTKIILNNINYNIEDVNLLDPLLNEYIKNDFSVTQLVKQNNANIISEPLEAYKPKTQFDIVVCINVLDHVFDADLCLKNMVNMVSTGGMLIFGQDLTNKEDFKLCPETVNDIGHPIKLHYNDIEKYFSCLTNVKETILPRDKGRNPKAHYGTLLYVGVK